MYALVAVGGDALPASAATAWDEVAIADTIVFLRTSSRGGRLQRRVTNSYPTGVQHGTFEEEYVREDGVLLFVPPYCPPNALCAWMAHEGRFEDGTLTITFADARVRTRRYQRVP